MNWSYPILAFFIVFIIGFGLVNVLKEDVMVAPWAAKGAEEGRLFAHTKNVTRLTNAGPADLHAHIKEAIPYKETQTAEEAPSEDNWMEFVTKSIQVNPDARHVVILPAGGKEALQWALPAVYYAFYYGSPVAFAENGQLRGPGADHSELPAYLIGPEDLLPNAAGDVFATTERITANNPHEMAVQFAEYRNEDDEFGWGRTYDRRNGYFHYVVTTPDDVLNGLAALPYARSNNASLLYANEDGSVSAPLERYMWTQRAEWMVTPSEGPFRHFWIVSNRISYPAAARMDFSIEKAEYASMGAVGLGPTESLLSIFVFWGIASALFVWIHGMYCLPMVILPVKIAWALSSLVLPILGPILYINAYRRPTWTEEGGYRWLRTHAQQSAAATAMGFGYGATLMIAIGFLMVWFGFPIFFGEWMGGSQSWLGAGMPIMMFLMWALSILVAFLLVQYPMKKSMMKMPKAKLRKMAFSTTFFSMTAVSLGMMTMTWYMLMDRIRMMPKEDDLLWFCVLFLASMIGFLVAWPLNWIMIRNQLKPGNV